MYRFVVVCLCLILAEQSAEAWTFSARTTPKIRQYALANPSADGPTLNSNDHEGDSNHNMHLMGRILEGGQVIDFSSVKASSKAESALAEARQHILEHSSASVVPSISDAILGINADVIREVGHDLGTFCTAQEVLDCAAYLRSKAPVGLLEEAEHSITAFTPQDVARFQTILAQAYEEAGEVTGAFAKTFYMGTMLMPELARQAIWAVYVWCRRTDEIVDAPRDNDRQMLLDLASWELRLEQLWSSGQVVDVYDLCLLDVRIRYPTMDIQPFLDMIRGMLMDVPDLGVERYINFDELHLYCYRVAGTVGVMSLPVFGCAPGFNEDIARYVILQSAMNEVASDDYFSLFDAAS
jgi:15-cis-phytoene synthase